MNGGIAGNLSYHLKTRPKLVLEWKILKKLGHLELCILDKKMCNILLYGPSSGFYKMRI